MTDLLDQGADAIAAAVRAGKTKTLGLQIVARRAETALRS